MRRSLWNLFGVLTGLTIVLGGFAAASAQEPKPDKPAPKKEETKDQKKDEKKADKDIVETASANKDFSTLVELLKAADLVDTLKGEGPFTVFAPTNEAFEKLGKEKLAELKKDKAKLAAILKFHVHSGAAMHADAVTKAKTIKTVNGQELTVTVKEKDVHIGTAKVTKTDIKCKNGVIHVIDTVQLPKEKTGD